MGVENLATVQVDRWLTSQSTCLFNRFAPFFGEVTIGWLTEGQYAPVYNSLAVRFARCTENNRKSREMTPRPSRPLRVLMA